MFQAFGDIVYPVMFGGNPSGEKEMNRLKEVLGWVDGFVKVTWIYLVKLANLITSGW